MPARNDTAPAPRPAPPRIAGGIRIDTVWAGVATGIGTATMADGTQLFAYYDADRHLTLASIDPAGARIAHRRLASRFDGWDAHHAIALAVAPDGSIHVAGNMHASPLVYARADTADISTARLTTMTGTDEASATYPHFLRDMHGDLLFMYRDGGSGAGRWLLNRWHAGAWLRVGALFADHDRRGPISAYPTGFVRSADGRFHVAVVWRRTNDVATNFALSYASTEDFRSWRVAGGAIVDGPLSPETMEAVDATGENAGLVNNASLAVDRAGRPIILYTKYGAGGRNAIFVATRRDSAWSPKAIATAPVRVELSGRGTIPDLPGALFTGPATDGRHPVHIVLPQAGGRDRLLDEAGPTLADRHDPPPAEDPAGDALMALAQGMEDVVLQGTTAHRDDGTVAGRLRWYAQKPNRDRPREASAAAPRAAAPPPSPLLWFPVR